ncbi:MAG: hypothetical protein AAFR55_01895 [Pseudomonadota bacterium]
MKVAQLVDVLKALSAHQSEQADGRLASDLKALSRALEKLPANQTVNKALKK